MAEATLRESFDRFCELVQSGQTMEAIQAYFAADVVVFENRDLARAGREACLTYEREELEKQPTPPTIRIRRRALDESSGIAFIEYDIRFMAPSGRPMRLEEVAVQSWSEGLIESERFYYPGFVDEGD